MTVFSLDEELPVPRYACVGPAGAELPIPRHVRPKRDDGVDFDEEELARVRACCRDLGTTFQEFIHFATMAAVSECEGIGRVMTRYSGPSESQVTWILGARVVDRSGTRIDPASALR